MQARLEPQPSRSGKAATVFCLMALRAGPAELTAVEELMAPKDISMSGDAVLVYVSWVGLVVESIKTTSLSFVSFP